jgi:hypothetical protein
VIRVDARDKRIRILAFDQRHGERERRPRAASFRLLDDRLTGDAEAGQYRSAPGGLVGGGDNPD